MTMLKRIALATAAAGFLAAAAIPSTASAGGYGPGSQPSIAFQLGGPGWNLQFGNPHPNFRPQKVCAPVVQKVKWWDNWGNPHWSNVVVGQNCSFGGRGFGPGNGPGWGNGPGPGFPHPGPGMGGPGWGGNW
jgi:hypothetical protein